MKKNFPSLLPHPARPLISSSRPGRSEEICCLERYFLVQIELWKIGSSDPAPKFVIISRPNDWAKSVKASGNDSSELSETKLFQLEFWKQLKEYASLVRKTDDSFEFLVSETDKL